MIFDVFLALMIAWVMFEVSLIFGKLIKKGE